MGNKIDPVELDFLLRFPAVPNVTSPVDFLSNNSWGGIKALSAMDQFRNLDRDIEVMECFIYNIVVTLGCNNTRSSYLCIHAQMFPFTCTHANITMHTTCGTCPH